MIALVSVHEDPNFGSMLQAYALAKAIENEGHACEYLSYTPKINNSLIRYLKSVMVLLNFKKKYQSEYSFWSTKEFYKQRQLFKDFHARYIPVSGSQYNPRNIGKANCIYDLFFVGSDQTWSPNVTCMENSITFLPFVKQGCKKASYAPSIGTISIPPTYKTILRKSLESFAHLSCREYQNAVSLSKELGRKVEFVLDPTFLLNKADWLKVSEPIDMPSQYILCYILGTKQSITDFAEKLGNLNKIPVYYIVTCPKYLSYKNILRNVSVGQFLTLINNASYVVTDSFHGTILSINFGINFYSFTKRNDKVEKVDNDRIIDFLNILGLSSKTMILIV